MKGPFLLLVAAALLTAACEDSPARPGGPGDVIARVASPNGAEGAALVEIAGRFGEIRAEPGTELLSESVNDSTARVMLLSDRGGELTFRIHLDERRQPPRATILQVADTLNALRPTVSGYKVTF